MVHDRDRDGASLPTYPPDSGRRPIDGRVTPYDVATRAARRPDAVDRAVHGDEPRRVGRGRRRVGRRSATRNDLDVLLTLRRLADVVIVGAGTARGEGYGPPKKAGQRIGVATNSGHVDLDSDAVHERRRLPARPERGRRRRRRVEVLRAGHDRLDIAEARRPPASRSSPRPHVQAEGGPAFNGSLLAADLIDELDLTLSPHLVGGTGPTADDRARAEVDRRFELAHLLVDDDGFVFSRWARR